MYYIGIDGGGTKTKGILCNEKGEVIVEAIVGATNPTHIAFSEIINRLTSIILQFSKEHVSRVKSVFIGISGFSHLNQEQLSVIEDTIQKFTHPSILFEISHDADNALLSGTLGKAGMVTISGTGAMTYGINEHGSKGREGGWGYLIDHAGCGYGIGLAAVKRMLLECDKGLRPSVLTEKIKVEFSVSSPEEVIPLIYDQTNFRQTISSLTPLVFELFESEETESLKIIQRASGDISQSINNLATRLFPRSSQTIPVICTGGLFKKKEILFPLIEKELADSRIELSIPQVEPAIGAVIGAFKLAGLTTDFGNLLKQ